LQVFTHEVDERRQTLVNHALGEAKHGLANWLIEQYGDAIRDQADTAKIVEQIETYFSHAETELEAYSDHLTSDARRQVEMYRARGSLYRDRGLYLRDCKGNEQQAQQNFAWARDAYSKGLKAAEDANLDILRALLLEDMGDFHFQIGALDQANDYLEPAERIIPDEYKLHLTSQPQIKDEIDTFWQVMGKIYLGRALQRFKQLKDARSSGTAASIDATKLRDEAVEYGALATGCFMRFSDFKTHHRTTFKRIYAWIVEYVEQVEDRRKIYDQIKLMGRERRINVDPLLEMLDQLTGIDPNSSM
jgi:tetratricopeptide (TPR) repeat protein